MTKVIFSISCVLVIGVGFLLTIWLADNSTHAQDAAREILSEGPSTVLSNPTPANSVPQSAAVKSPPGQTRPSIIAQRPIRVNANQFKVAPIKTNGQARRLPAYARSFVAPSRPVSKFPTNAKRIKRLVRANYSLSQNVAETMERLFALDKNRSVETNIIADDKGDLVQFQVTTDEQTQRSVAEFLNNVFPTPDIFQVHTAPARGFQQISLKLPGMTCQGCVKSVRSSLTSIGATKFEANLATHTCSFRLPTDANIESQLKIAAKTTQHLKGWSIVK